MKYEHFAELPKLKADGLISARPHPHHPLTIYNYSAKGQHLPVAEWSPSMKDCRGLILDDEGEIVGRPFRKFWNSGQVEAPANESFQVWEKLDGSLGIVCIYAGERIVATRGSFESDQANWLREWFDTKYDDFYPSGETWLFEIVYPGNRIVVDYGDRKEAVLLGVMSPDCVDLWDLFESSTRFRKAQRFDGLADFSTINSDPKYAGSEGFVVQYESGFRMKVKLDEYCRLHRLITQCSTRTIWELLRAGTGIQELIDRVPAEFAEWVNATAGDLIQKHTFISADCTTAFLEMSWEDRKDYARQVTGKPYANVMFAKLDGKLTDDMIWRMVEPAWATPFRGNIEE